MIKNIAKDRLAIKFKGVNGKHMSKEIRALTARRRKYESLKMLLSQLASKVSAYKKNYGQAQNVEVEFDKRKVTCMYMRVKRSG